MKKQLKKLKHIDSEIKLLSHTAALLGWDQETYMPKKAITERAEQISLLQGMIHEKIINPKHEDIFAALGANEQKPSGNRDFTAEEQAFIRETYRRYKRNIKIPKSLVQELARATSIAQAKWVEAKKESRFFLFKPYLEKVIGLVIQMAECLGYEEHRYDPLLDEYEPWMKTKQVESIFSQFQDKLAGLVEKIVSTKKKIDSTLLKKKYSILKQREFSNIILKAMGFDPERGRLDISAHPFTTTLGSDDVRLTTRYNENFFSTAIFGTIHECGHGLYELGFSEKIKGSILEGAASLGIHESQSRMWENMVGRSYGFWKAFFPKLKTLFPEVLATSNLKEFYGAINVVEPSLIRVEADEVTYNLHIIIRFNLEKRLISGELAVSELPEAWCLEYKKLLGLTPENDADGVLQDIHWSMGAFGYFPTYTLGNLYAAQFYATLKKTHLNIEEEISQGKLTTVAKWLRKNIHSHGSIYPASVLCERITAKPLDASFFMDYLNEKYGELYAL